MQIKNYIFLIYFPHLRNNMLRSFGFTFFLLFYYPTTPPIRHIILGPEWYLVWLFSFFFFFFFKRTHPTAHLNHFDCGKWGVR